MCPLIEHYRTTQGAGRPSLCPITTMILSVMAESDNRMVLIVVVSPVIVKEYRHPATDYRVDMYET